MAARRRQRKLRPEPAQDLMLADHVMRAAGQGTGRRAAEHCPRAIEPQKHIDIGEAADEAPRREGQVENPSLFGMISTDTTPVDPRHH